MLRLTTAGVAGRAVRLFLLPSLAALALACDDASSPVEPLAPQDGAPQGEAVPTRGELAALIGGPRYWADAYAWAGSPTTPSYPANPYSSFNRTGGPITITKPAGTTGRYVVTFGGLSRFLGSRSTVQVTSDIAAGTPEDTYCKPLTSYLVSDRIEVSCYGASTRAASNAGFHVMVTRNYTDLAFAFAHQPAKASYNPSAQGTWNPAGSSRVIRHAVGQYEVVFNNLGSELPAGVRGHVQVSAVGTGNAYCKVENWGGAPNVNVAVRCFTGAGQPVDAKFTVLFAAPTDRLGYAWANQPSTPSYSAVPRFGWNASGGPITINRTGTGTYQVVWPGLDVELLNGGNIHVTAYGSGNEQCRVDTPAITSPGSAYVRCFGPSGAPTDTYFNVLVG